MQLNTLKPLRIQPEREHQKQNYFHLDDWVSNLETESPNLVGTYLKKTSKRQDMQLGVGDGHIILKVIFSIARELCIQCMIRNKQILIEYSNVYINLTAYEGRC